MARTSTFARNVTPIALAWAAIAAPVNAQTSEELAATVAPEAESGAYMGAALVAKGDEVILDQAWGEADLEWDIANTTDTKFRIGSVTKQFTAVSILLLQERGLLTLDDPISMHLKDTPETWAGITVRHILRHTAGLPNITQLAIFRDVSRDPVSKDEVIGLFRDLPLEFEPGSSWKYSNSGYILASKVVENVSRKTLADFYQSNIFDKLGMADTGLDVSATILPKRAAGYSPDVDDSGVVNADYVDMGAPSGAGAMYSTTGDLLKWQRGLFGGKVISQESLAQYVTPGPYDAYDGGRYALGISVFFKDGNTVYAHAGGIKGFNAWLGYDPEREITVAVLANLNGGAARKLGPQLMEQTRGQ
ncbi:MAG: serine hydrolase domain-containing protein [Pseudomonadota bacterium]